MKALISWFAHNRVAANLMMITIFILGGIAVSGTKKELIPNVSLERIGISTILPGASVNTIEINVCKPIEDRIYDVVGVIDLLSVAYEGVCSTTVDVKEGVNLQDVLEEIKARLSSENILPESAFSPEIKELNVRNRVSKLILSGNVDYESLVKTAHQVKRDLIDSKNITIIDIEDITESEIKIEVPSYNLKKYGVSLNDISKVLTEKGAGLSGGRVKSHQGEILITGGRVKDQIYDYENILIPIDEDKEILLGDIAVITDNRVNNQTQARLDNVAAMSMDIYRVGEQNIVDIAKTVSQYVVDKKLPSGMSLTVWQDDSKHFSSRISLLIKNALGGLILLFFVLLLFLDFRLSFWVSLGIPISFFGAFMLLPVFDVSINIISLFAFILVLGIVVDDAVVIGESIYEKNQQGVMGTEGSIQGVYKVYKPVLFAVATSIIAFFPLLILPGPEGKLMQVIPIVVIATLLFSLFESLCILPAHLSRGVGKVGFGLQGRFGVWLKGFIDTVYQPLLLKLLRQPGSVALFFAFIFLLLMTIVANGWLKTALFSAIEGDVVIAHVEFPEGTPRYQTQQAIDKLNNAANEMLNEDPNIKQYVDHVYSVIGPKNKISNLTVERDLDHIATVTLSLTEGDDRTLSGQDIIALWRNKVGVIEGADELTFNASLNPQKPDIHIEISGYDLPSIKQVSEQLKQKLASLDGIYEIKDSMKPGKQQANIVLNEIGRSLNLSLDYILAQVNQGFEGAVVDRIQSQDDEVEVWLGLPASEQASIWHLENFPIRLPDQSVIPLSVITHIQYFQAEGSIRRYERKRVASVTGFVDSKINSVSKVKQTLAAGYLDDLTDQYDGVSWSQGGQQKSISMFMSVLSKSYLVAILVMYLMMAILFSSYSQPLLILLAVPFGLVGSFFGHMILGLDLTLWSFVGMVAVSGVVVNDNLVLLDYVNQKVNQGADSYTAICDAGKNRFRPILLTSLTTFIGLVPLIMEDSIQAQFLIPMAVSLAFGVLFATVISLFFVPCSYLLLNDLNRNLAQFMAMLFKTESTNKTVEQAYALGFEQGSAGKYFNQGPFSDEVLNSSWEAGWHDADNKNNKNNKGN